MPQMLVNYNWINHLDPSRSNEFDADVQIKLDEIANDYATMVKGYAELRVDVDRLKASKDIVPTRQDYDVKIRDLQQARTYDIKQIQMLKDQVKELEEIKTQSARGLSDHNKRLGELECANTNAVQVWTDLKREIKRLEGEVNGKISVGSDFQMTVLSRLKNLEKAIDRMENDGK